MDAARAVHEPRAALLAASAAASTTAEAPTPAQPQGSGDPTELAILRLAEELGVAIVPSQRKAARRTIFPFDAHLKRMSTVNDEAGATTVHTNGAPEAVLPCCTRLLDPQGKSVELDAALRGELSATIDGYAASGLRVLAIAHHVLDDGQKAPAERSAAESDLTLIGPGRHGRPRT
ncbi:hypothetical protein OG966_21645 [Streptomyces sp. NBC_01750]|nr:hypothetical protein OG966_21645 [Streptomyces sp. NBC_01750]